MKKLLFLDVVFLLMFKMKSIQIYKYNVILFICFLKIVLFQENNILVKIVVKKNKADKFLIFIKKRKIIFDIF